MSEGQTSSAVTAPSPTKNAMKSPEAGWAVKLLREPLVHFVLLGALLFALYAYRQDSSAVKPQQIVVTAGKIEHLSAIFSKTWQRPPTVEELQGLIDDYIREEVAYREGKAMGLDQDDTIIRRRIRQKLDFFAEDMASQTEPTETQLMQFFSSRRESYATDTRFTFRQIFFDPERHGNELEKDMMALVEKLESDPSVASAELGDRSLLEYQFTDESQRSLTSIFGDDFAAKVAELPLQSWQGPILSAYGVHLVIVDQQQQGRLMELDEVREAVRRDWENGNRLQLAEDFYRGLQDKYQVKIEWPTVSASEE